MSDYDGATGISDQFDGWHPDAPGPIVIEPANLERLHVDLVIARDLIAEIAGTGWRVEGPTCVVWFEQLATLPVFVTSTDMADLMLVAGEGLVVESSARRVCGIRYDEASGHLTTNGASVTLTAAERSLMSPLIELVGSPVVVVPARYEEVFAETFRVLFEAIKRGIATNLPLTFVEASPS